MQSIVNLMGTLTVGLCAFLLLRAYTRVRKRLLLWSGMCFAGLTVANALLIIDRLNRAAATNSEHAEGEGESAAVSEPFDSVLALDFVFGLDDLLQWEISNPPAARRTR